MITYQELSLHRLDMNCFTHQEHQELVKELLYFVWKSLLLKLCTWTSWFNLSDWWCLLNAHWSTNNLQFASFIGHRVKRDWKSLVFMTNFQDFWNLIWLLIVNFLFLVTPASIMKRILCCQNLSATVNSAADAKILVIWDNFQLFSSHELSLTICTSCVEKGWLMQLN